MVRKKFGDKEETNFGEKDGLGDPETEPEQSAKSPLLEKKSKAAAKRSPLIGKKRKEDEKKLPLIESTEPTVEAEEVLAKSPLIQKKKLKLRSPLIARKRQEVSSSPKTLPTSPKIKREREDRLLKVRHEETFNETIQRDFEMWARMLNDGDAENKVEIMQRVFFLIAHGGLEYKPSGEDKFIHAPQEIPTATYLSQGGRVMIIAPPGLGNALWNWITTGNPNPELTSPFNENVQKAKSYKNLKHNHVIYNREGSTHDIKIQRDKKTQEFIIEEVKLESTSPKNWLRFVGDQKNLESRNWGMNVAVGGAGTQHPDYPEKTIQSDGTCGHVLFVYDSQESAKKKKQIDFNPAMRSQLPPDVILIGAETSAYGEESVSGHKHNMLGKPGIWSITGNLKWKGIASKLPSHLKPPERYGGLRVNLTMEKMDFLFKAYQEFNSALHSFSKKSPEKEKFLHEMLANPPADEFSREQELETKMENEPTQKPLPDENPLQSLNTSSSREEEDVIVDSPTLFQKAYKRPEQLQTEKIKKDEAPLIDLEEGWVDAMGRKVPKSDPEPKPFMTPSSKKSHP